MAGVDEVPKRNSVKETVSITMDRFNELVLIENRYHLLIKTIKYEKSRHLHGKSLATGTLRDKS